MAPVDLRLRAIIDSKQISDLPKVVLAANDAINRAAQKQAKDDADAREAIRRKCYDNLALMQRRSVALDESTQAKRAADADKMWQGLLAKQEKAQQERIALQGGSIATEEGLQAKRAADAERAEAYKISLQRNSLVLEEKIERQRAAAMEQNSRNSLQITQSREAATLRIERQAAQAESSLVLDKFERRIAVERTKHQQILADLKGNDTAQEAEIRRHNAVVSRMQMDKANLPNTPFQQLLGGVSRGAGFQDGIAGMAGMAGMAIGATVAFSTLKDAIGGSMDAALQLQSIKQALDFTSGSAKAGAEQFEFLRSESMRLGLNLKEVAPDFTLLAAAAMHTKMEGKGVQDLFRGISEANVTLHLTSQQTAGALNAFQQMLSKGKVQAQEMNLQLGNALPGSLQLAADAMNLTKTQFIKMMSEGKIVAEDFLPKMADQLHKTFGESAVKASENARQSMQKFNNIIFAGASAVGGVFVEALGGAEKALMSFGSQLAELWKKDPATESAKMGRDQVTAAKRIANQIEMVEIEAIKSRFMHGRTTTMQEMAAMNVAIEAYRKKLATDAIPKKAVHQDTDDQIANQVKLQKELERARAEAIQDDTARALKLEEIRYDEEKAKLLGSQKEKEIAESTHLINVSHIRADAAAKAAQEQERESAERRQKLRDDEKKQQEFLVSSNMAAREKLQQLKKQNSVTQVKDKDNGSRIDDLKEERNAEIAIAKEKYADTEYYNKIILQINQQYADKNKALAKDVAEEAAKRDQKANDQKLAATGQLFGGIAALSATANLKDRQNRLKWKAAAEVEAGVNLLRAEMQVLADPATSNPYVKIASMAGIGLVGAATMLKIKDQQFYTGGYTGAGDPHQIAGLVHKDEYVVPHHELARAGGPSGLENMLQGGSKGGGSGGGVTHTGDVIIQLTVPAGTSQAQAQELGGAAALGYRDKLKEWKRMEKDATYYGVTA